MPVPRRSTIHRQLSASVILFLRDMAEYDVHFGNRAVNMQFPSIVPLTAIPFLIDGRFGVVRFRSLRSRTQQMESCSGIWELCCHLCLLIGDALHRMARQQGLPVVSLYVCWKHENMMHIEVRTSMRTTDASQWSHLARIIFDAFRSSSLVPFVVKTL